MVSSLSREPRGPRGASLSRILGSALAWTLAVASSGASAQEETPRGQPDPLLRETGVTVGSEGCGWVSTTELSCEPGAAPDDRVRSIGIDEAKSSVRNADYAAAAKILGQLVGDDTEDGSILALYGEVLVASGNAREAVTILERAISSAPDSPRLHFQLATAQTTLGNVDRALEAYATEIEINEQEDVRFLAHVNRSILLGSAERNAEAASALEQALEIRPDEQPKAYGELAVLYLRSGDAGKAAQALDRGAEIGFRSARLYFNLGAHLFNDKDYVAAELAFASAIEIDPEMAEAERSLAATLSQLDRADEARAHLARYLELRPDAPDAADVRKHLASSTR